MSTRLIWEGGKAGYGRPSENGQTIALLPLGCDTAKHLHARRSRQGSAPMWPGIPQPLLESVQSQNRVSPQSLWFDFILESLVAFSVSGNSLGIQDARS